MPANTTVIETAPTLTAGMDTESAFRFLIGRCCADVDLHIALFLEHDDPSGAHKSRVALRRLTTTLDAFRQILKRRIYATQRITAKAIFRELGKVREADVYLDLRGEDASAKARTKANTLRDEVRRKLRKRKWVGFAPALLRMSLDGSLYRSKTDGLKARARPVAVTAAEALDACWSGCMVFPADLSALSDVARHELRKSVKGLRYTAEFFAPVWQNPDWPLLRDRLRDLQDRLGHLNDLALARKKDGQTDAEAAESTLAHASAAWAALRDGGRWWGMASVETA